MNEVSLSCNVLTKVSPKACIFSFGSDAYFVKLITKARFMNRSYGKEKCVRQKKKKTKIEIIVRVPSVTIES